MAVASATVPIAASEDTDRGGITLLTVAHLMNDANQSALPAIIPWLVAHRGLSLATAATLVLAMNLSSSIVQPLFGHLSDRRSMAWVIPCALLLATIGTAIIGVAPSLPLMLLGALVSGIGVAAFHPEGSRFSRYFAGANRAAGMSWFTVGGYMGFALGPIAVTPLILAFGLRGVAVLLIPALVIFALVWRQLPHFEEVRRRAHAGHRERAGRGDDWRGFWFLSGVVSLRSMAFLAAVTFTPIFAMRVTHADATLGSIALAALLFGGAFGTVYGGRLADRIDRRRVVMLSLVCTAVFAAVMAAAGTYAPHYLVVVIAAACFGVSLGLSAGVIVVMGQEYLPQRIGVASGVTLGLAVTIGGLATPFFGWVGDRYGLIAVFAAISGFAVLSLLGSFLLPKPKALTT